MKECLLKKMEVSTKKENEAMLLKLSKATIDKFMEGAEEEVERLMNVCLSTESLNEAIQRGLDLIQFEPIYKKGIGPDRKYQIVGFHKGKEKDFLFGCIIYGIGDRSRCVAENNFIREVVKEFFVTSEGELLIFERIVEETRSDCSKWSSIMTRDLSEVQNLSQEEKKVILTRLNNFLELCSRIFQDLLKLRNLIKTTNMKRANSIKKIKSKEENEND